MEQVLAPAASEPNIVIGKESLEPKEEASVDDKSLNLREPSEKTLDEKEAQDEEIVMIIEHCVHCSAHGWNTRHDEAKYLGHAKRLGDLINSIDPNIKVLFNQVPKDWHKFSIYYQLIHNNDKDLEVFDIIPKLGSFEVSTVVKVNGQEAEVLIFSKML